MTLLKTHSSKRAFRTDPPPFLGDPAMTPVSPAVLFLPGDTAVCHSTLSKDYARFRDFFPTDLVPILKWVWGGGSVAWVVFLK